MTTATELVTRAFSKIMVRSADVPLAADELQGGIDQLNSMMSAWNYSTLAYVTVTSGSQTLATPEYAEDAMIFGLALRLGPEYGVTLTQLLYDQAKDAKKALLKRVIKVGRSPYPSTLPQGSGNSRYLSDREFYPPSTGETTP